MLTGSLLDAYWVCSSTSNMIGIVPGVHTVDTPREWALGGLGSLCPPLPQDLLQVADSDVYCSPWHSPTIHINMDMEG